MPLVDDEGRILALVNVIDLLAVLLAIAVFAAGSALLLSQSVSGPLTAVVAVVGLLGIAIASKRSHDVSWETVGEAARDAVPSRPSRPSLRGIWRWLTAEPDPDVIVIDLRETVTVGPVILVLDWIVARLAALYRGSTLERALVAIGTRLQWIADRTGLSALAARLFSVPEPPEQE